MELTIEEVFEAYYACRKNKRYAPGSLAFETNYESRLIALHEELVKRTWQPGKSTCFIVKKPVRREVFAASFQDRIVHHILVRRMESAFEKHFIFDSYACRTGKGTRAAILRAEHFVKSFSDNGKKDAYILKLDIQSFFMSIHRPLLYRMLTNFVNTVYANTLLDKDASLELYLIEKIVLNNPSLNCIFKSPASEWEELPKEKSLFTAKTDCGIPIGNLTSQVFANFYLSPLDHYAKHILKIRHYVRYVDDLVIICTCPWTAHYFRKKLSAFLKDNLFLKFNSKKIYVQHIKNGFQFLGTYIKPSHTTCAHRIKDNFVRSLKKYALLAMLHRPCKEEIVSFRSSVNSYLGILSHYKSYTFRVRQLDYFCTPFWSQFFALQRDAKKIILAKKAI